MGSKCSLFNRLPWSRWHWLVAVSPGITWILDDLEVTIIGAIAAVLTDRRILHLSNVQASAIGTGAYGYRKINSIS